MSLKQMNTIEKIIHQKEFKNDREKAMISILVTSNLLITHQEKIFKNYNITQHQYNVLRILRGALPDALNISTVKERMIDKNSDASRMIKRLFKIEMLERVPSATDKRAIEIKITPKGLAILAEIDSKHETDFWKNLEELSTEEVGQLNEILHKILNSALNQGV